MSGKLKAWVYAFAGIGGIVEFSAVQARLVSAEPQRGIHVGALVLFVLAAAVAVWSLVDYAMLFS